MAYTESAEALGYGWAFLLGLVQGLTEFLPVSSSGHLALVGRLRGGVPQDMAFDILLHAATMLVVIGAFWKDLVRYWNEKRIIIAYLVVGSIPTAFLGLLCRHWFEALRDIPMAVCGALFVTSAALFLTDRLTKTKEPLETLGWNGSLIVGLCQALAITPGISRSGLTITGGLVCGLNRDDAIKFSFLLMLPAVGGATLLEAIKMVRHPEAFASLAVGPCLLGFVTAAVSGYLALRWLIGIVRKQKLIYFALYCAAVATLGTLWFGFSY